MNKDEIIITTGDKLTYIMNNELHEAEIMHDKDTHSSVSEIEGMSLGIKILKIERPKEYETIYEYKPEDEYILTLTEKRYLEAFLKPFKHKVKYICKKADASVGEVSNGEYLIIEMNDGNRIVLPTFKQNTLYKGMVRGITYNVNDLRLFNSTKKIKNNK